MKIIPFGCSHMASITSAIQHKNNNEFVKYFDFNSGVIGGNSNQKIIEDVYRTSNKIRLEPKFTGPTNVNNPIKPIHPEEYLSSNSIFYIQTSYTNRLWLPTTLDSYTSSFHTMDENGALLFRNNPYAKKELLKFYETYIKYFWNYHLNLLDLLQKIDMLQTYLKSKNIKFIHMFWSFGGNSHEWLDDTPNSILKNADGRFDEIQEQIKDILNKIEYIKPYGYNTTTDWILELQKTHKDEEIFSDTIHLSEDKYYELFKDVILPECELKLKV